MRDQETMKINGKANEREGIGQSELKISFYYNVFHWEITDI